MRDSKSLICSGRFNVLPEFQWGDTLDKEKALKQFLDKEGFCVIRGLGHNLDELTETLGRSGFKIFIDDLKRDFISTTVHPREISHAERLLAGCFHTDFSQHQVPPKYLALLCLKTDPRHPFYGRNQVVHTRNIFRTINELDEILYEKILNSSFPTRIRGHYYDTPLISKLPDVGDIIIRFHPGYIEKNRLNRSHFYRGIGLHEWIELIAFDLCFDFALNETDCLIASNYRCFHRRDTATLHFDGSLENLESRTLISCRYL